MTTPSSIPVSPRDDAILDDMSSADLPGTMPKRRSARTSYMKGAPSPMDGGDAATTGGDRPENCAVSTSNRPLSATVGDGIIGEGEATQTRTRPAQDIETEQLQDKDTKSPRHECLKETEDNVGFVEEEYEVENLVKLVLQKVEIELILEILRNSSSDEAPYPKYDSSGSGTYSSECLGSTDEHPGLVAVERKDFANSGLPRNIILGETDEKKSDFGELETGTESSEEAEQQLEELIRSVLEKQLRQVALEKDESNSSCIHETEGEGDAPRDDDGGKREPGLDFRFHNVMRRLTGDIIEDSCWEDEIDLADVIEKIAEVTDEEQAVEKWHVVSEVKDVLTKQPRDNKEVVSDPFYHNGSESTMEEARTPQAAHMVPDTYEVPEAHDEVQRSHSEVPESHKVIQELCDEERDCHNEVEVARGEVTSEEIRSNHAREVAVLLQDVHGNEVHNDEVQEMWRKEEDSHLLPQHYIEAVGVPAVESREFVSDHMKMKEDDLQDGSSDDDDGDSDDDDDELLTSEGDEELDAMVGFVINSCRSSLMSNFDVFTFNKLSNIEEDKVLETDASIDRDVDPLICSEDKNSTGNTLSEISAAGEISKAEDRSRQDVSRVDDEGGVVKNGSTLRKKETQFSGESLPANPTASSAETIHVTTDSQSRDTTDTLPLRAPGGDSLVAEETSRTLDATSSVIGQKDVLTAADIASDSDDDDLYESETTPSVCVNTAEYDWECLAIRQISKSQPHVWYPTHDSTNLGMRETSKRRSQIKGDHLEDDESTLTKPVRLPSNEGITSTQSRGKLSTSGIDNSTHVVSSQADETHSGSTEKDSGVAVINDQLRKKILQLEQRLKELALELTFLGDRNWRLEAYIDCLIKTLEVLEVTDVVDLDEKTLSLCLFKVKVKAGYKLGSYNGIPSRALWSYREEGRQPPFVDLSGWGDTDKAVKRPEPVDFTPTPSSDDDVGLSVSQMYRYESQLEELSTQNQILEAQLREAQELAQAFIDTCPDAQPASQPSLQGPPQQKDQGVQTGPPLVEDLEMFQQEMPEYQDEDFWQQPQQQIFTTAAPPSHHPESYVMHDGKQYPLPLPQHILPQQQQQHHRHQQQFQHYHSELQPQQQQQQKLQQPQPNWTNRAGQEEMALQTDWDSNEELSLYDPLEWPTLTESQAQNAGHAHLRQHRWLQARPFSQSAASVSSDPAKDRSTLHSSLAQPASTGSIPNHENRHQVSHRLEKRKESSSGSVSCQSLHMGHQFESRRFESNNHGPARYNHRSLEQSRSGIDTVPRGQRQDESMRFDYWDPPCDYLPLSIPGEFSVSLHDVAWHHEDPSFHTARDNPPLPHHPRHKMDRNRRFFQGDNSVLDSYRPDFSEFHKGASFHGDIGLSVSSSKQIFEFEPGCNFQQFPAPPSSWGFSSPSGSTSVSGLPYSNRRHDKPQSATAFRRGKQWSRAGSPRHPSCNSPLKSCAKPERTHSNPK